MSNQVKSNEKLSLEVAARKLATTKVHLLMMVKRGLIPAEEIDGEWYVDPAAVDSKPAPEKVFKHTNCKKSSGCGGCH